MYISLLKSKIHRAVVTGADVNYEGSLSISADLAELVGLEEYERILVGNLANGERFETYVIYAVRNHGTILLEWGRRASRETRRYFDDHEFWLVRSGGSRDSSSESSHPGGEERGSSPEVKVHNFSRLDKQRCERSVQMVMDRHR